MGGEKGRNIEKEEGEKSEKVWNKKGKYGTRTKKVGKKKTKFTKKWKIRKMLIMTKVEKNKSTEKVWKRMEMVEKGDRNGKKKTGVKKERESEKK